VDRWLERVAQDGDMIYVGHQPDKEGAGHLSMRLASVVLGICPISCNNPIKKFLYLVSANSIVR